MNRSRLAGLVALLLLAPAIRAASDEPKSPWRDAKVLEARLAEACDAVEKATGAAFPKRPTVRLSTSEEVGKIARAELAPVFKAMGIEEALDKAVDMVAAGAVAKYEPATHVIHVVPDVATKLAKAIGDPVLETEECLRVILAHEATHAIDYPRYGWEKVRDSRTTQEGLKAFGAMVEGHAQLVAEEVAKSWGLEPAFAAYTRSITALPPIEDPTLRQVAQALVAEVGFGYVQGHAFLRAVKAARGAEGVEAALSDPPAGTRVIEHPEAWLNPGKEPEGPDLAALLDGMRYLVAGPGWTVQEDRVLEATLRTQLTGLPEEARASALDGYDDGRLLAGSRSDDGSQLQLVAMRFRTADAAKAWLAVERRLSEGKDEAMKAGMIRIVSATYAEGTGPGGAIAGYACEKTMDIAGDERRVLVQLALLDRVVLEVVDVFVPGVDRSTIDEAVARAAAWVADPAKGFPPREPLVIPKGLGPLVVRVLDGDGKPVPRAKAAFTVGTRASLRIIQLEVEDGRVEFPWPKKAGTVAVWAPATEEGEPLPWGPARVAVTEGDSEEVEVRLPPERTIVGRVADPDGAAVSGASVAARAAGAEDWHSQPQVHGSALTDADGRFEIHGLGDGDYRLEVTEAGDYASPKAPTAKGGATGVEIVVRKGVVATITVLDEAGRPIQGARVGVGVREPIPNGWRSHTATEGETGPDGTLRLSALDPSGDYELHGSAPAHRTVREAAWKPADTTLRLGRSLEIRGRVRDAKGNPVRATVWAKCDGSTRSQDSRPDGLFRIDDLPYGPVKVGATPKAAEDARPIEPTRWVEVDPETPTIDLVVEGKPGVLHVEGGVPNQIVVLVREGADPADSAWRGWLKKDLTVSLAGVDADAAHVLWIPATEENGRTLLVRGFKPGTADRTVVLIPGKTITVRLKAPGTFRLAEVAVLGPGDEVLPAVPSEAGDGAYLVRGLADGTWKVKAKARGADAWLYGTADVEAGSTAEITLAPK